MVEYGGGIHNGPAGQVGGGAGAPDFGGHVDFFSSMGNVIHDATNTIASLPPELLAAVIVTFFVGLVILKRAF